MLDAVSVKHPEQWDTMLPPTLLGKQACIQAPLDTPPFLSLAGLEAMLPTRSPAEEWAHPGILGTKLHLSPPLVVVRPQTYAKSSS